MTAKPKTRQAPAAKMAKAKAAPAPVEQMREVSEIRNLISRRHWLDADQVHSSDTAAIAAESERVIAQSINQRFARSKRLSKLVPKDLWETMALLRFAAKIVTDGGTWDHLEVKMLAMAEEGVRLVWCSQYSPTVGRKAVSARVPRGAALSLSHSQASRAVLGFPATGRGQ